jgi:pyruvate-formate lyase-activating enzyme
MNQETIQEYANENNLDVKPIQDNHYRLVNQQGEFIWDIYFKKNKKGKIVKNSVLNWRKNKWFVAMSLSDLQE